uniref:Pre-mRNA-splicing factor Syf1/CRNKL1-like C-terminal HAT-repeats domain-containing protein n=1 Tax=Picocystis salinarum TaxID=88271 RepID=A0A7S3UEU4_9CHLO
MLLLTNLFLLLCWCFPCPIKCRYKYIHMEEMLGNVAGARQIFERWLKWTPEYQAWRAYIKMELRYNEVERARKLYKRYVGCCNTADAWIEFAKFEMRAKQRENARGVYEKAVQELIGDLIPPEPEGVEEEKNVQEFYDEASKLLLAFASFEILCGEMDRARAIYSFALHTLPSSHAPKIEAARVALEKQYGTSSGVEVAVLIQRRRKYEEQVKADPHDYDAWFDLVRLEEQGGNIERIRSTFQEVVQHPPPMAQNGGSIAAHDKMRWKRFVYLWIEYALFEEIMADDLTKANQVYRGIISMIPHKRFTFAKLWINAAEALIRTKDLPGTRKLLGQAVGLNPSKTKILDFYVDFELQLGNISRCRKILESALSRSQTSAATWIKFSKLESELEEDERARAILDLAIQQEELDSPELVWKHYIDFEIQMGEREKARALYEQLLSRTSHVKVWISYAAFEAAPITNELEYDDLKSRELRVLRAREVFKRGHSYLRGNEPHAKHECVALLEAWESFEMEAAQGNNDSVWVKEVNALMPRRVKRRRLVEDSDIMEDYYEYIFPDEAAALPNLKLLEAAQRWKRQKLAGEGTRPDTALLEGANDVPEEKTTDGG